MANEQIAQSVASTDGRDNGYLLFGRGLVGNGGAVWVLGEALGNMKLGAGIGGMVISGALILVGGLRMRLR